MKILLLLGAMLASVVVHAEEPLIFDTYAKVELDAAGAIVRIEPDAGLATALQDEVRKRVAAIRFEPPERDGVKTPGATYVLFGGCAVPDGEDYYLSLDNKGNGPKPVTGYVPRPAYPPEGYQRGYEATAKVTVTVEIDGNATLDEISYEGRVDQKFAFDRELKKWVAAMRYLPEELSGKPIETQLAIPVDFRLGGEGWRDADKSERADRLDSRECMAAKKGSTVSEAVVLDSPIRVQKPSG